ncbi:MAG: hypothetical protein WKF96_23800, partial [Solirubrobacteraceae bacterium]
VNAILAYLSDGPGLGHRYWLLDPTIGTMGTGSTDSTNALYVRGADAVSPTVPQVVAWPAPGDVPWPLIKGPWSAALNVPGTVDASNPTVEVKIGGRTLPVSGVNGGALGYGWIGRTIEWNVAITAADREADARIDVTIRGVKVNGVERVFSYTTNAMLAAAPKATTFTGSRTPNSVTVRWDAATPQGVPITGYRVTAFEDGQYPNFVIDQTVGPAVRELTLPYTAPTKTLAVGVFATSRAGSPLQNGFIAVAPPTTKPPATTPTTTPPATTPAPTTTTPRPPPAIVPTIPAVLPIPPPAPVGQKITATTGARARFVGPVTVRLVGPGRARAGRRLKARSDVRDQQRLRYSWRRNGRPIGGATRSTYRLRRADRGSRISCRLTAVGTDGVAVRRTSQPRLISRR